MREHRGDERFFDPIHGLGPRRAVHVHNSRYAGAPRRPHPMREQHERAGDRTVEDVGGALFEHHRCNRPELLAALDVVEARKVLGTRRVRQQTSMAERARAPLATALHPRDHAVVGDDTRNAACKIGGPAEGHVGTPELRRELFVLP